MINGTLYFLGIQYRHEENLLIIILMIIILITEQGSRWHPDSRQADNHHDDSQCTQWSLVRRPTIVKMTCAELFL